jgi:hypothetical protein
MEHTSLEHQSFEQALTADWLGLAGYLAEAVQAAEVSFDDAQAELCAEVTGAPERRALVGALDFARTQLGADALITKLLHGALISTTPVADVA